MTPRGMVAWPFQSILVLGVFLSVQSCVVSSPRPANVFPSSPGSPLGIATDASGQIPESVEPLPSDVPTLTPELAHDRVHDLLAGNGGCMLPCLWKITPGTSTPHDARGILEPLTGIADFESLSSSGPNAISLLLTQPPGEISIYVTVSKDNQSGTVSSMTFEMQALEPHDGFLVPQYGAEALAPTENYYALERVLSAYGQPDSVWLATSGPQPPGEVINGTFEILLIYPQLGVLGLYTTDRLEAGQYARGCPTGAHVRLILYPRGQSGNFVSFLGSAFWDHFAPDRFKPLEKATNLTVREFYERFHRPNEACIDTPSSIWPVPGHQ